MRVRPTAKTAYTRGFSAFVMGHARPFYFALVVTMALWMTVTGTAAGQIFSSANQRSTGSAATLFRAEEDESQDQSDPEDFGELDDGDGEEDEDGDEDRIEQLLQELFLGTAVYPQERREWQFTLGYFDGFESEENWRFPFEIEYGLTDRWQVSLEVPTDFLRDESPHRRGVSNIALGTYYNFYADAPRGSALGVGMDLGFPSAAGDVGPDAYLYEPFFVAYQEFGPWAVNFSAALEIEDPLNGGDASVGGELAVAAFRRIGRFVPLLEASIEIEADEAPLRVAPGMYWQPRKGLEIGASLPIGLNDDAADLGFFMLVIFEFGGDDD